MTVDSNLVLVALGTIIYAAYIFRKLAALATIAPLELAVLQAIFSLPLLLLGWLTGTSLLVVFVLHMATGAVLFPFLARRSKYGVLHRQGFLRLVSLGKVHGTVVRNEAGLADIDILVVDPGELEEIDDDGKAKLDPRLKKALENGTSLETVPEFLARNYGFIEIKHHVKARQVKLKKARLYDGLKAAFEILITLVLLVLLFPVLAIVWCIVYFASGSPIIFRQERMGKGGRSFDIYKFRTMENDGGNPHGLGQFLRETHLDELPQFFNILKGDMVLIGPRPEWIYLTSPEEAPADYWIRRTVKPGLSGWAQVNYRPSFSKYMREKKLGYDIFYINNRSIFLDSLIWVRTLSRLMRMFTSVIHR